VHPGVGDRQLEADRVVLAAAIGGWSEGVVIVIVLLYFLVNR
jgi:hypothetical protein